MALFLLNWLAGVPEAALPYALGALGLIISERAGVLSLTGEGLMLVGALAGVGACLLTGNDLGVALGASMIAASFAATFFALLVVVLRVNQVIAGLGFVFFCQGLTSLLGNLLGWQNIPIPGMGVTPIPGLADIPYLGRIFFDQNLLAYAVLPIAWAVQHMLMRSVVGLRLRAVGESPEAADAAGIDVLRYRVLAIIIGASLVGLAGFAISVTSVKVWFPGVVGGRGWIAVALVIFARWRPWRAVGGAVLFGCIESLAPRVAAAGLHVPEYLMLMLPYAVTLGVMVWTSLSKQVIGDEPGALAQPYLREERR